MPELTHDTAEDGFHEIQLSGKQLVFLFGTATAVLVVTFLCGVLVGRNARTGRDAEALQGATAVTTAPATASAETGPAAAEPPAPPAEDALTYHDRLRGKPPAEQLKPKTEEPPAAVPAPPESKPDRAPLDVPTAGRRGTWFVQVQALQNRAAAADVVRNLIKKGYPAYLELPAQGATAIYRVRIGRFNDRREAEQVARRLKEQQLTADVRR